MLPIPAERLTTSTSLENMRYCRQINCSSNKGLALPYDKYFDYKSVVETSKSIATFIICGNWVLFPSQLALQFGVLEAGGF
jgi:hypothetical protein